MKALLSFETSGYVNLALHSVTSQKTKIDPRRFRGQVDENCALLGYYAGCSGNSLPTFRENLSVLFKGWRNFLWFMDSRRSMLWESTGILVYLISRSLSNDHLLQSELCAECDLVLGLSVYSISSFPLGRPVAYIFFFMSLLSFLQLRISEGTSSAICNQSEGSSSAICNQSEGSSSAICNQSSWSSFVLLFVGYSFLILCII